MPCSSSVSPSTARVYKKSDATQLDLFIALPVAACEQERVGLQTRAFIGQRSVRIGLGVAKVNFLAK
jgi:hypothetical protein